MSIKIPTLEVSPEKILHETKMSLVSFISIIYFDTLIIEKAREFQKNIYYCFIDYAKALDWVDHNKLENSERDGNTRPPDLPLEKSVCRSGNKLELDMEQQTGSK